MAFQFFFFEKIHKLIYPSTDKTLLNLLCSSQSHSSLPVFSRRHCRNKRIQNSNDQLIQVCIWYTIKVSYSKAHMYNQLVHIVDFHQSEVTKKAIKGSCNQHSKDQHTLLCPLWCIPRWSTHQIISNFPGISSHHCSLFQHILLISVIQRV